ncbi:hypothetical protein, partial [Streptomyces tendae]|uniref:hypothetical protein n=1 Tax=Streptomyces tendae TaxID=1932 RepID=UPI0036C162EA
MVPLRDTGPHARPDRLGPPWGIAAISAVAGRSWRAAERFAVEGDGLPTGLGAGAGWLFVKEQKTHNTS